MNDKDSGHYQYSIKQGEEIYLIVSSMAEGREVFLKRVNDLRDNITTPAGATPDRIAAGSKSNGGENAETGEFATSKLVKSVTDGKTYWKVAGLDGKFPKFPVPIWPEIIERDLCSMDKLTKDTYPLEGYMAVYEKNEKGNPRKVIELAKGNE